MLNGCVCRICGKPLEGKKRKYCSDACLKKGQETIVRDWKEKHDTETVQRKCGTCGVMFETKRASKAKVCSSCKKGVSRKGLVPSDKLGAWDIRPSHIDKINAEAKANGMTYGQLQAMKLVEQHRIKI